jgi:hypothetical protein
MQSFVGLSHNLAVATPYIVFKQLIDDVLPCNKAIQAFHGGVDLSHSNPLRPGSTCPLGPNFHQSHISVFETRPITLSISTDTMCLNNDSVSSYTSSSPRSSVLVPGSPTCSDSLYKYEPNSPGPSPEISAPKPSNPLKGFGQKARRIGKTIREKGEQFLRNGSSRHGPPRPMYDLNAHAGDDENVGVVLNNMGSFEGIANNTAPEKPLPTPSKLQLGRVNNPEASTAAAPSYRPCVGEPPFPPRFYANNPDVFTHQGRIPNGTQVAPAGLPEDHGFLAVAEAEKRYNELFQPHARPSSSGPRFNDTAKTKACPAAVSLTARARRVFPASADRSAPYPLSPAIEKGFAAPALLNHGRSGVMRAIESKFLAEGSTTQPLDQASLHLGTGITLTSNSAFSLPARAQIAELSAGADVTPDRSLRHGSRSLPALKIDFDRHNDIHSIFGPPVTEGKTEIAREEASTSELEAKAQKQQHRIPRRAVPNQTSSIEVIQNAITAHLVTPQTGVKTADAGSPVSPLDVTFKASHQQRFVPSSCTSQRGDDGPAELAHTATSRSVKRVKAAPVIEVRKLAGPVPIDESRQTTASLLDGPISSVLQSKQLSTTSKYSRCDWNWGRFVDDGYEDPAVAHSRHFREKKAWAKHNNGALIAFASDDEEKAKDDKRKSLMTFMKDKSVGDLLDFFESKK